jgi:hypothetical protein
LAKGENRKRLCCEIFITNETQQCEGKCAAAENFVEFGWLESGSAKIAEVRGEDFTAETLRRREISVLDEFLCVSAPRR